ncbi:DUF1127 domain-containing protein [Oceaniglobus ichthyenteri]|uniref:DUF1127 domain-containing protein n=1 Tax=Oceaniglobus ichthyenteri TaxID=2136177 RepID=UPI000D393281|nr:DUF1127 domain-containing protein [Oceaniglobus ichthyenteri]
MSVFEHARPAAPGIAATLLRLTAPVATWNAKRVTRKSLSRLTDYELDDIGLTRSDIERL